MLSAVGRHWVLALLSALAAFAGCVTALSSVPNTYTATSVLAMLPRVDIDTDLLLLTIPNYSALATSQVVTTEVGELHDEAPGRIQDAIGVANPPASNSLLVSVEWDDPDTAALLANSVTDALVRAAATDPILSADVVAQATPPTARSWPPWRAGLVLSGLLSLAVGGAVAWVADWRRQRVAAPDDVSALVEQHGPAAPVLLAIPTDPGALTGFLAGTVERVLADHTGPGTAHIAFLVTGRHSAERVSVVADVAAALDREDRRVFVLLDEREGGAVRWSDLQGEPAAGAPGRPDGDAPANDLVLRHFEAGSENRPRDAAALLVVSDRLQRALQESPSGTLDGAVTVVLPRAPGREIRAALRALDRTGVPHLAVVQWLRPRSAGANAVSGSPSRTASVRADAPQEPGRSLPSPRSTSHSS